MPKVLVRDGMLIPLDPLPGHWAEGSTIDIEESDDVPPGLDDGDWRELERLCAQISTEEYARLERALVEQDRLEKDRMRREMGLP